MYRVHGSLMAMQRQCWFSIPCLLQGEIRCESILGPVVRGHQVTEVGKTVKKKIRYYFDALVVQCWLAFFPTDSI